jgi:hypothetical protein
MADYRYRYTSAQDSKMKTPPGNGSAEPTREPHYSLAAEQAALGGILLGGLGVFNQVKDVLLPEHLHRPDHRLICSAFYAVARSQTAIDAVTVADWLDRAGQLRDVGGLAYLGTLCRDTAGTSNVRAHAEIIIERAKLRRLTGLGPNIERAISEGASADQIIKSLSTVLRQAQPEAAQSIQLSHISDIVAEYREPEWLEGLHKILEREVLAVLAGPRGTFKSFVAQHWAMTAAKNGHPVVMLNGEGAGIDRRADAWMRHYAPTMELKELPLLVLERPLNLNASEVIVGLVTAIEAASFRPALIVIDTFSKYAAGLDENDNSAVAAWLAAIVELIRERFGCTILLVAHSGHSDPKRPRGASALMANPDSEFIVHRPDVTGMIITVSRERFKDAPSLAPLVYKAQSVDLNRRDRHGDPVNSLVMIASDQSVSSRRAQPKGANVKAVLAAVQEYCRGRDVDILPSEEWRKICRSQNVDRKRQPEVEAVLIRAGWLQQTIGGLKYLRDEQ